MSTTKRFYDKLEVVDVDPNSLLSAFAGEAERERMSRLRKKIEIVRKAWLTNDTYMALIDTVREYCKPHTLPREVKQPLEHLLRGFHDYADIDLGRPAKAKTEQFDALELYCSVEGYEYLWKLVSRTLRQDDASDELLLTATTLVEFLTIDLYNLRLSQLGDPRYANFEGLTHRGLSVRPAAIAEYEAILARPDLTHRGFAIPLGLTSTSTDVAIMQQFAMVSPSSSGSGAAEGDSEDDVARIHLAVHVRGIEPTLLRAYRARYPDSVVSSICAMPVARFSPVCEKEVLLRGAFFQLLAIHRDEAVAAADEGLRTDSDPPRRRPLTRLIVLMMNANRDHTTELSSNLDDKKTQRDTFRRVVEVSKYLACARLAAVYSAADATRYAALAEERLHDLRLLDGFQEVDVVHRAVNCDMAGTDVAVWLGGALHSSYPRHYASQRHRWHHALSRQDWIELVEILDEDYKWRRYDWYNVCALMDDYQLHNNELLGTNALTLLHVLAGSDPPSREDFAQNEAWNSLVDDISNPGVWKSLRSFDRNGLTPSQIIQQPRQSAQVATIELKLLHHISEERLKDLENKLHKLIRETAVCLTESRKFHMPQLSVLAEMVQPALWIPIPHMYGGFMIQLDAPSEALRVDIYRTVASQASPVITTVSFHAEGHGKV